MFGETISVTRPGALTGPDDAQGNPTPAASTTFSYDRVAVAPGTAEEQAEQFGPRSENAYTLFRRRAAMDLRAQDMVTIRGVAGWQVTADARTVEWRTPYNGSLVRGTVAEVRRVS
jgi:hypothetical protein